METLRLSHDKCREIDEIMFRDFSDKDLEDFNRMIEKITKNLSYGNVSEKEVFEYIKRENNGRNGDDKNA